MMTVPKSELKKKSKRFKKRQKKYKPGGWPIGGPSSIHPGLGGMGESVLREYISVIFRQAK